ncbi:PleD family two-component system response regulator [Pseudoalteromonas mariniglutinosa]|uniref:response regulator n=1 Tax=Pseudoalteromonas mariniglutinosa TaxID=206042 RepID=UPI00384F3B4C
MTKLVLAIDDDKLVHRVIEESLAGFCKLIHAKNGDEGLRQAFKYNPDIILLDVEMPGKTGYEVCSELKQNQLTKETPVMFLSGKTELTERVRGYNSGASDYIVKPFNAEELIARIRVLYDYRQHSKKLKSDIEQAQITAEIAMTDSGDMGRIMRYVRQSYHAHDVATLAEYLFEFFAPLKLDIVVAFWHHDVGLFYTADAAVCPLEQELIEQHRSTNRFVDFSHRTIVNYSHVSMLVKNMPLDDAALYGRYKDLFPHILDITNAKAQEIQINKLALSEVQQVDTAFDALAQHIHSSTERYDYVVTLFTEQLAELQHSVSKVDCQSIVASLLPIQAKFALLNDEFTDIKQQLNDVVLSRSELVTKLQKSADENTANEHVSDTDIELF